MTDNSRNHIANLKKRLEVLEKTLYLNRASLVEYYNDMTEDQVGIIKAQNALIALEIDEIEKELQSTKTLEG